MPMSDSNPNIEYLNSKQFQISNFPVWRPEPESVLDFGHSILFTLEGLGLPGFRISIAVAQHPGRKHPVRTLEFGVSPHCRLGYPAAGWLGHMNPNWYNTYTSRVEYE